MNWRLFTFICLALGSHLAAEEEKLELQEEVVSTELIAQEEAKIVQEALSDELEEGLAERLSSRFWGF